MFDWQGAGTLARRCFPGRWSPLYAKHYTQSGATGFPLCCRRGARCARVHCSAGLQRQPLFPASLPPAEGRRARRAYEQKPVADKRHASSHEPGSSGWTHLAFAGAQAAAFALPRSVSLTASVRGWEHQMHTVSSCDGQGNYSHDLKITNSHRLNSWLKLGLEAGAKIQRINTPFTEVRDETTRVFLVQFGLRPRCTRRPIGLPFPPHQQEAPLSRRHADRDAVCHRTSFGITERWPSPVQRWVPS